MIADGLYVWPGCLAFFFMGIANYMLNNKWIDRRQAV